MQTKNALTSSDEARMLMNSNAANPVMVDLLWSQVEMVRTSAQVPLVEAFRRVRDGGEYDSIPESGLIYEALQMKLDELVEFRPGPDGPIVQDELGTWYLGPSKHAQVWGSLRKSMENGGMAGAVDSIDDHSTQIVQQLAEPFVAGSRRRGLVIGHVQSGKTANYASVIAKAVDARYRMVVVLAGMHSNLRAQTQRRLTKDLGIDETWVRLTDLDKDMGRQSNAVHLAQSSGTTIAVIKKQKQRLANLERYLADLAPESLRNYPILIIDDESDQASPDSSLKDDEASTIHELLLRIWSHVNNGTYVSYTATPFANLFMEPDREDSLYPRDFIHVLPEPQGYLGTQKIFGAGVAVGEDEVDSDLDLLREIPNADREAVVPPRKGRGEELSEHGEFSPSLPVSLREAVRWFLLASAVRRYRGQIDDHSSMLVHTTHETEPHFRIRDLLNSYLGDVRTTVLVDGDYSAFEKLMVEELPRVSELRPRDVTQPSFEDLEPHLRDVLADVRVYVDNGSEAVSERVQYRDDRPLTAIIVGGNTLSRGLTLEGLFVSYFARNSATYDTLLQMGRWFGFRPGYGDLVRLWLSEGLAGDYQFLADVEAQVRSEVRLMQQSGQKPSQVGVRVKQHPGRLSITGRGKMKHTQEQDVGLEGRRVETNIFDVAPATLRANLRTAWNLVNRLQSQGLPLLRDPGSGSVLYRDVSYVDVRAFLESYVPHSAHGLLSEGGVLQWLDKWDDQVKSGLIKAVPRDNLWNVVVISGASQSEWTHAGLKVNTVSRAPLKRKPSSIAEDDLAVGIRALMSASDHVSDLRILRASGVDVSKQVSVKASDSEAARIRQKEVDGRGLLVIYIIDKDSQPRKANQQTRRALDAEEHVVGFGMMAPSNPGGRNLDDEVYIGVTPHTVVDDEYEDDELPRDGLEDLEGDYVAEEEA